MMRVLIYPMSRKDVSQKNFKIETFEMLRSHTVNTDIFIKTDNQMRMNPNKSEIR